LNDGSPLVVLGLKTEGVCTVLENHTRGSVIHGGMLYMVRDTNPNISAFINANGSLLESFAEESFRSASRYAVYLRDPRRD
jgi:hypothetical protein